MREYLSMSQLNNSKWYFIIGLIGLSLLFILGSINGKFWGTDFEVYYYAAHAFLEGNDVYGVAFGNSEVGFYKYSPVVLFLYIPASLLPFKIAVSINYFLLALVALMAILTSAFLVVKMLFGKKESVKNKLLFIVLLLSVTFINRDLLLGNVNTLMLLFVCLGLFLTLEEKPVLSGSLYGLAIIIKPYLVIVILPLLMNAKRKTFFTTLLFIMLILLSPFVVSGWTKGYQLYMDWFSSMVEHSNYIVSPYTFDSLVKQYFLPNTDFSFSVFFIALFVSFYLIFKLVNYLKGNTFPKHASSTQLIVIEAFTLLALIPNLVNTDTQQLMYTIPLVAFLIQYLILKPNKYLLFVYVVVFFFFSIDQPDILGRALANTFYQLGLSGISNLVIIGMSWLIFISEDKLFFGKTNKDPATVLASKED